MIQKKKKQLKVILLIALVVLILGVGTWGIFKVINNNGEAQSNEQIDLSQFELKSLIVTTKLSADELKDRYSVTHAESLTFGENEFETYEIKFNTEKDTKEAYEKLQKDNDIKNVDINEKRKIDRITDEVFYYNFTGATEEISSWGPLVMQLDRVSTIIDSKTEKQEIIVAVIDSGFDSDHSMITGSVTLKNRVKDGFNTIENNTDITDNNGHGTNVGSIILEGTPSNVKILPIKALDVNENGEAVGTDASIIRAINYAVANGADIINMSLGGEETTQAEQEAINNAHARNSICIAASGNGDEENNALNLDDNGVDFYPAESEHVITVGAVRNKLLNIASTENLWNDVINQYSTYKTAMASDTEVTTFSNYGQAVDFVGPGEWIIGLSPETENTNVGIMSGTSQATPHISAAAALLKSYNKNYTTEQIETILKYYSYDLGETGKDPYYGYGLVNFKDFEECTCGSENCDKIYCFGCDSEECKFPVAIDKELASIAVTTQPTKKEYEVGDLFNKAGMVVTATYSDGTTNEITDYTYEPVTELTMHDDVITITYTENEITKTTTLDITVTDRPTLGLTLESIEITAPPTKTKYNAGETFDKTGMVVTATYDDGSKKIVTNYTYTPNTALTEQNTEIEISYTEDGVTKTAKQIIEVIKVEEKVTLNNIRIATPPNKTTYEVGEMFEKAGMIVIAEYSNGTEKVIDRYTVYPTTAFTASSTKVTIEYSEDGITKTVDQPITINVQGQNPNPAEEKTLSNIMMKTKPNKTEYTVGERFDTTGMEIVATYSDGTTKVITNYTYSPLTQLKATDTQIVVSYKENDVTKTINVPITVSESTNRTNDQPSGINDNNMFEYVTDNNSGSGTTTNTRTENKDGTTAGKDIVYAGLEEHIIPMIIAVVAIIGLASFVSYRRYKDI